MYNTQFCFWAFIVGSTLLVYGLLYVYVTMLTAKDAEDEEMERMRRRR